MGLRHCRQFKSSRIITGSKYNVLRVPLNLLESTPPKVSSPLVIDKEVVGSKEIPICFAEMIPWENKLSVTVGTNPPADVVPDITREIISTSKEAINHSPSVKSVGPMLNILMSFGAVNAIMQYIYPRIPSTPLNPKASSATPMDCPVIVKSSLRATVSRYSSPRFSV